MKTKGLVLEVQKNNVIVMTADGQFQKLPKRGRVEVGDEYSYATSSHSWLAVASVMVLLVSSLLVNSINKPIPSAYISVDINPSVELLVTRNGKVISAEALNQEADIILQDLKLNKLPLDRAIEKIIQETEKKQFAVNEPVMFLTAVSLDDSNLPQEIDRLLTKLMSQYKIESEAYVALIVTTNQIRDEAKANGISTGKYAVYLEAVSQGYELEIASLQEKGIVSALVTADARPLEVFQHVKRDKDLLALAENVRQLIAQRVEQKQEEERIAQNAETPPENTIAENIPPTGTTGKTNRQEPTVKETPDTPPVTTQPTVSVTPEKPEEEPEQEPEEEIKEPINEPIILPAENEPILEEATRRNLIDWFRDLFMHDVKQ